MKHYILFTAEELDDMIHGEEIQHQLSNGETVYFMCKEHFSKDEPDEKVTVYVGDVRSLLFEMYDDASHALNTLKQIIEYYGVATLSDLYDIVGLSSKYTDNGFGWTSLEKAEIVEDKHGYELKLPRALPLE